MSSSSYQRVVSFAEGPATPVLAVQQSTTLSSVSGGQLKPPTRRPVESFDRQEGDGFPLNRGIWLGWLDGRLNATDDTDGNFIEVVASRLVLPLGKSCTPHPQVAMDFAEICRPFNRNLRRARMHHLKCLGLTSLGVVAQLDSRVFSAEELAAAKAEAERRAAANLERYHCTFGDEEEYHFLSLCEGRLPVTLYLHVATWERSESRPFLDVLGDPDRALRHLSPIQHHNAFLGSYSNPWTKWMHSPYRNWTEYMRALATCPTCW